MSSNSETRQVGVLTAFTDRDGVVRSKGSVFAASYANERQRRAVNEMIHRGFLTFDTEQAEKLLEDPKGEASRPPRRSRSQG